MSRERNLELPLGLPPTEKKKRTYTAEQRERGRIRTAKWRAENKEHADATARAWREANRDRIATYKRDPERRKKYVKGWRALNPEKVSAYGKRWRDKNPDRVRSRHLHREFGITAKQFDQMLFAQGGKCAICKEPETAIESKTGRVRSLAVDHCHRTGKVRGLLCSKCNRAIGFLKDDPGLVSAALQYLLRWAAQ